MEIDEFENPKSKIAKRNALPGRKVGLLRPLSDEEFEEMMKLGDMLEVII